MTRSQLQKPEPDIRARCPLATGLPHAPLACDPWKIGWGAPCSRLGSGSGDRGFSGAVIGWGDEDGAGLFSFDGN